MMTQEDMQKKIEALLKAQKANARHFKRLTEENNALRMRLDATEKKLQKMGEVAPKNSACVRKSSIGNFNILSGRVTGYNGKFLALQTTDGFCAQLPEKFFRSYKDADGKELFWEDLEWGVRGEFVISGAMKIEKLAHVKCLINEIPVEPNSGRWNILWKNKLGHLNEFSITNAPLVRQELEQLGADVTINNLGQKVFTMPRGTKATLTVVPNALSYGNPREWSE